MTAAASALEVLDLKVERGGHRAVAGVSFQVKAGEVYALLGGNGAGKSTTLLTCLGLLQPAGGSVRVMGLDPSSDPVGVRQRVAYLSEQAVLYDYLTARENLRYFLALADRPCNEAAIDAALDRVGLQRTARDQRMTRFSKGMRQKVAIALALLRATPVLLLDEPTSGLDPNAVAEFNRLVHALCREGTAILMVTHDLYGACEVAARVGVLHEGRLVAEFAAEASADGGSARIDVDAVRAAFARQGQV